MTNTLLLSVLLSALCVAWYVYYSRFMPEKHKQSTNDMAFIFMVIMLISLWLIYFFGFTVGASAFVFLIGLAFSLLFLAMSNGDFLGASIPLVISLIAIAILWAFKWLICSYFYECLIK